jgi:serine/threonine protein kinase
MVPSISLGDFSDRYIIGSSLGKGASGVVYSCLDLTNGGQYAVKVIERSGHMAPTLEEFQKEVRILSILSHPSIVKLHHSFMSTNRMYMVFAVCKGGSLLSVMKSHWKKQGDIPLEAVRTIVTGMAQSLSHIHSRGIIHRDVKGENCLLNIGRIDDPNVCVKLSDFGCAEEIAEGQWLTEYIGTSQYLSPEMIQKSYGTKTDVWSLGVCFFTMMARKFPFDSSREIERRRIVAPERLPPRGQDLFLHILCRDQDDRLSAKAILNHDWLQHTDDTCMFTSTRTSDLVGPTLLSQSGRPQRFGKL